MEWKIDNSDYADGYRNEHGVRVWKLKSSKKWKVSGVGVPMVTHQQTFATVKKAQQWVNDNIATTTTEETEVNENA